MFRKNGLILIGVVVAGLVFGALIIAPGFAAPLMAPAGTSFTYQGFLNDGGSPANGLYDFEFRLYDDEVAGGQVGSTLTLQDVTVSDGLFTVELDFGDEFDGTALWLEIWVRPGASTGGYQQLLPRQALTAVPLASYALSSASIAWNDVTGVPPGLDDGDDDTTYFPGNQLGLVGTTFNIFEGPGSGLDADSLDGISSQLFSQAGHDHWGHSWSGSSGIPGLTITNTIGNALKGETTGTSTAAIFGYASSSSGTSRGITGWTDATQGIGVYGVAWPDSGVASGVIGGTFSPSGYGGFFWNAGGGALLAASNNSTLPGDMQFRVSNVGNVFADGAFTGGGADFAELLPARGALEPGDVICMGSEGIATHCSTSFEPTVLGVYSTDPGFVAGGGDKDEDREDKAPIAMMGLVPVKASAENGPIQIGDLLVSAGTPGHAMRCEGIDACFGRTIGKALESLDEATGVIQMLVMLQ